METPDTLFLQAACQSTQFGTKGVTGRKALLYCPKTMPPVRNRTQAAQGLRGQVFVRGDIRETMETACDGVRPVYGMRTASFAA